MTTKNPKTNRWTFDPRSPRGAEVVREWNGRVIRDICLRTRPIDDAEWSLIVAGLRGMYDAAKLPHRDLRIVKVASPFMAHIVASYAASWWKTPRAATRAATYAATYAATDAATRAATDAATRAATYAATDAATYAATDAATRAATDAATGAATRAATYAATRAASDCLIGIIRTMKLAAQGATACDPVDAFEYREAGAEWYHWHSYIEFVRSVVGFTHATHANFKFSNDVQSLGSVRYAHREFVVVSDHPTERHVEWRNGVATLHREDGPAVRWSDGTHLWAIDGTILPHDERGERIVMRPESFTVAEIDSERNNDIRSIMLSRFGLGRYLTESGAAVVDEGRNDIEGTHEALMRTPNGRVFFWPTCPSGRVCPPLPVPDEIATRQQARDWLAGGSSSRIVART